MEQWILADSVAHRLGTQGNLSACMSHKPEAACIGSKPVPPWSALAVLFLNKPTGVKASQSQGEVNKRACGTVCQLLFKFRGKHVLLLTA